MAAPLPINSTKAGLASKHFEGLAFQRMESVRNAEHLCAIVTTVCMDVLQPV